MKGFFIMLSIVDTLGQEYYAGIKDNYKKKWDKFFKALGIQHYFFLTAEHRYDSIFGSPYIFYASVEFNLEETRYSFSHNFDEKMSQEDFEIELDKLMRKWYKIIKEIVIRIECYEEDSIQDVFTKGEK